MNPRLRIGTTSDRAALEAIYRAAEPFQTLSCDQLLREGGIVLAELDGNIVAFGGVDVKAKEQLRWLYVLPELQQSGIGSKILQRLEAIAKDAGLTNLYLHAAPSAVPFYGKNGYVSVLDPIVKHDHDGVQMIKILR